MKKVLLGLFILGSLAYGKISTYTCDCNGVITTYTHENNGYSKEIYVDDGTGFVKYYKSDLMEYLETTLEVGKTRESIKDTEIRFYVDGNYSGKKHMSYSDVKRFKEKVAFVINLENHMKEKH
ncbi:MAG: hypothetical protein ACRDDF_04545 [Aeromonas sp.]